MRSSPSMLSGAVQPLAASMTLSVPRRARSADHAPVRSSDSALTPPVSEDVLMDDPDPGARPGGEPGLGGLFGEPGAAHRSRDVLARVVDALLEAAPEA